MPAAPHRDEERFEALKRTLADVGFFRRGSVVKRFMPCGKPGCHCHASPPQLHGPYFQWTRKVKGKTVTVSLSPQEAQLFQQWIANGQQLNRLVSQMEIASTRITERLRAQLQQK
jgi:hypothetical protein